ncbi:hypothetical protein Ae201684_011619 [Aphanomyces euteiches]|uniref:Uncharacterized protein n=1 Tax=Aphanomyces euteiches TaxID=100861 RepID=A0A6G0WU99_9STRA|nr:hypothetical protein Ae201684_011619 [Aphanomyces euteiches]
MLERFIHLSKSKRCLLRFGKETQEIAELSSPWQQQSPKDIRSKTIKDRAKHFMAKHNAIHQIGQCDCMAASAASNAVPDELVCDVVKIKVERAVRLGQCSWAVAIARSSRTHWQHALYRMFQVKEDGRCRVVGQCVCKQFPKEMVLS